MKSSSVLLAVLVPVVLVITTMVALVLFLDVPLSPPVPEDGKADIALASEDAEERMKTALKEADNSVMIVPRRELEELKMAGQRDQEDIAAFGNNQAVSEQLNASVHFWEKKMQEVIEPFLAEPKKYNGMYITYYINPPDPDWNDTEEYRAVEKNINDMVNEGVKKINLSYKEHLEKTKAEKVEEVTASSWAKLLLDRSLKDIVDLLKLRGQSAKIKAADNKDVDNWLKSVKNNEGEKLNKFNNEANEIYIEYKDTTTN